MAAKKKLVTVSIKDQRGNTRYTWTAALATVHTDKDGKTYLNIEDSPEAGDFGIEVPRGSHVEVTP